MPVIQVINSTLVLLPQPHSRIRHSFRKVSGDVCSPFYLRLKWMMRNFPKQSSVLIIQDTTP